jgi:hypothetical protein
MMKIEFHIHNNNNKKDGFSLLLFVSFVGLPLAYFYGEEKTAEYSMDIED